jgi:hypothetical protein
VVKKSCYRGIVQRVKRHLLSSLKSNKSKTTRIEGANKAFAPDAKQRAGKLVGVPSRAVAPAVSRR